MKSFETAPIGFHSDEYRLNLAALIRIARRPSSNHVHHEAGTRKMVGIHGTSITFGKEDLFVGCRRADHGFWQCPQGGLETTDSSAIQGIVREIVEELGVAESDVKVLYESKLWRRYDFGSKVPCEKGRRGQQQKWFLCEIPSLEGCFLERSHGEFSELKGFSIDSIASLYASWKAKPFFDFCYELQLLSSTDMFIREPHHAYPDFI